MEDKKTKVNSDQKQSFIRQEKRTAFDVKKWSFFDSKLFSLDSRLWVCPKST